MNNAIDIRLPGGLWLEGTCYRDASLRPLTGEDESFLLDVGDHLSPAGWTTALLSRCLTRLGPLSPVSEDAARSLTIGDREALLLHLRRLTLGNHLECRLICPAPGCMEKLDLDLSIDDLLLPPYTNPKDFYAVPISEGGLEYTAKFRLPTGADQEVAVGSVPTDLKVAENLILRRCIASIIGDGGKIVEEPPPNLMEQIPTLMASLDPQAELVMDSNCPVCGGHFSSLFDTASFFRQELSERTEYIYREVHMLAFYYHWSEAEIMGMARKKRLRYLDLIEEALGVG